MTTCRVEERTFFVCGEVSEHRVLQSTSAFGSSDLDTRPPYPQRYSIDMWVQRCSSCGHCAPDISEGNSDASTVVQSDSYQKQLENLDFPQLANYFLCWSLIQESLDNSRGAAWGCIHAAWACDDADNDIAAQSCRKRAVTLLRKAQEKGQSFAKQEGGEEALTVDLLRRSGQFELASRMCEEGLKKNPENMIPQTLQLQKILIGRQDIDRHVVQHANPTDDQK